MGTASIASHTLSHPQMVSLASLPLATTGNEFVLTAGAVIVVGIRGHSSSGGFAALTTVTVGKELPRMVPALTAPCTLESSIGISADRIYAPQDKNWRRLERALLARRTQRS